MKLLSIVYLVSIALFALVLVWACFDVHNRIPFALFAQAPVLILRVFWKHQLRKATR